MALLTAKNFKLFLKMRSRQTNIWKVLLETEKTALRGKPLLLLLAYETLHRGQTCLCEDRTCGTK